MKKWYEWEDGAQQSDLEWRDLDSVDLDMALVVWLVDMFPSSAEEWASPETGFEFEQALGPAHNGVSGQAPAQKRFESFSDGSDRTRRLVLGIVFGSLTGLVGALMVCFLIRVAVIYVTRTPLIKGPIVFDSSIEPKIIDLIAEEACLNDAEVVGGGPNGKVFKVGLENGRTLAVKRLDAVESHEAMDSAARRLVQTELLHIGKVRHQNLVLLQAYIPNPNSHLLVYDLVPFGSLEDALRRTRENRVPLSWKNRQKIAVGIILGLEYLHFQCRPCIVHCDLKPRNVLLGEDYEPFLVDFGLEKLMPNCGAPGYVAPECHQSRKFTDKSDVFSFGVVLAVLLTGREPTDSFFDGGSMGSWLRQLQQNGKAIEALDKGIVGEDAEKQEEMLMAVRIAAACLADIPSERPSSAELVSMLTQMHSF